MAGLGDPADSGVALAPGRLAPPRLAAALINSTANSLIALQRFAADAERAGHWALKQLQAMRKLEARAAAKPKLRNEPNSRPPATSGHSGEKPPTRGNPSGEGGWKM
jgi:hypothetical protein